MKYGPYNVFTNEHEKYHMAVILQNTNIFTYKYWFFFFIF
jgi:hypothetical protein